MKRKYKVAVCQMMVGNDKDMNIDKAVSMIEEAAGNGAELIVLPEIFNGPYSNSSFEKTAEKFPGITSIKMMETAKKLHVYIVAGSISEIDDGKYYNTSYFFDAEGHSVLRHRKMHLFDIDIKGGQYFKESDTLTAGDDFAVAETELGKIGIGICYDVRFPEYFRILADKGAQVAVLPAAFNMTTGPAHWEISVRMRALDNQMYMIAASPARNYDSEYISYANSMIADPWGKVIAKAGEEEEIIYAYIDLDKEMEIRESLPLLKHRRLDRYRLSENN